MKVSKWTLGLVALGLVSPAPGHAEEKMNQLWTALSSTTLSGYVNTSINWNTGTGNERVPNYVYNDPSKQDGFNLNVVDLTIEKALDEAQWAAGYKVQLWFGPDATTFGSTLDSGGDSSPVAIKQAYVGLRTPIGNGLDFKLGVFDGLLGYESHDAGRNPNYTRAYGLALTPHTHTGLEMSYQFSPLVSASAAIANTVGPVINAKAHQSTTPRAESYKAYTAAMALTAPEDWGFLSGSTLYSGFLSGNNENTDWNQVTYYAGITLNTPVKAIKVGSSYAYLGTTSSGAGADNYANALAGYVSFQASEKLSLHGRAEYVWTDTDLFGTVPVGGNAGGNNEIFALTGTIQYDLWKNVISRLEIRWDHLAGDGDMVGYGSGTSNKRNGVLIAANVIYQF
ncbi:MAG TPA: outer membrane beta-barrel protein [Verrucomicrobiae bacterium]|nr:outer membrane beta-barrel protein [Verrucomicrobiae bacterium]